MGNRRIALGTTLLLITLAAGCATTASSDRRSSATGSSGTGSSDKDSSDKDSSQAIGGTTDVAALDQQAKAALAAWEPVLSARAGAPFLLKTGEPSQVVQSASGTGSDMDLRFKADWIAGRFTARQPLSAASPPAATIAWPGGGTAAVPVISAADALHGLQQPLGKSCDDCTGAPLEVTGAELGTISMMSSRGSVQVPAWIFSLTGYATKLAYPAVAPTASVLAPDAPQGVNGAFNPDQKATVSADQRTLTVTFESSPDTPGPCGSDVAGHVFEAAHVVAVVTVTTKHPGVAAGVCPAIAQERTVTISLTAPLAGRVVLGPAGMPLPMSS
ncbi:MAG: hypothetical protein HOV87_03485 [Catenulispora sp.]|nr:hypothetical protein [Catenulispora sp.]